MRSYQLKLDKFPEIEVAKYEEIRPLIKTGDVLLCSGRGFFARMIRLATDSIWSHVGLIVRVDSIDRILVLESLEPIGVRAVSLSKYLYSYSKDKKPYPGGLVVIRHKKVNELDIEGLKRLTKNAVDLLGYPYDRDEIARIALRITTSKLKPDMEKSRIERDQEFICSEYVARCFEEVGLDVKWDKRGFIAPADFARDENFEVVAVLKRPDMDAGNINI